MVVLLRYVTKPLKLFCIALSFPMLLTSCITSGDNKSLSELTSTQKEEDTSSESQEDNYMKMLKQLSVLPEAADVDEYKFADDGGMIYNPLSREAVKTGAMKKFEDGIFECVKGSIELDGAILSYSVPKNVAAYDVVPVKYTLQTQSSTRTPVYIGGTAFEEEEKRRGRDLYDLNIPGKVDIDFEYLGYVAGYTKPNSRPVQKKDFNEVPAAAYPNFDTSELRWSDIVESSDITWFKFKYTNAGNTIIDGDGNGTFMFEPVLHKKNASGQYEVFTVPENLFYRITDYIYPGESGELWITFVPYPGYKATSIQLQPGDYRIQLKGIVRNEMGKPEFERIIWSGTPYSESNFDFTVGKTALDQKPEPVKKSRISPPVRNKWLHSYEEFMSGFDTWGKVENNSAEGTLYIQVAPWTEQIVLKIITGKGDNIRTVGVPINVDTESIKVNLNPDNKNYVILDDGSRYPAITTQSMADMRGNIQKGPYPVENILNDLLDMKECGINLITSTAAFAYDFDGNRVSDDGSMKSNYNIDAFRYMMDCLRILGIKFEGFVGYPFNEGHVDKIASWISGNSVVINNKEGFGDPKLPVANAIKAIYQFKRWGDNYWQTGSGAVPLSIEDTRGWMRIDINNRAPLGKVTLLKFQHKWLADFYGGIEGVNQAWGSSYSKLEEINPENDAVKDPINYYKYSNEDKTFHDWSQAITDLDIYRTIERVENYKLLLEEMKEVLPNAKIQLRTEGANWMVSGIDPKTPNQRYRHIYYNQRRNAMIAEIMQESGVIYSHSDYTTLPYTPSEVSELTKMSVEQGIIPMHLPQFNRMRDIAINSKYGTSYKRDYNFMSSSKGAYISTLTAVFPWFKSIYDGGGVPGILWQDYLCDGYVTSTQLKEMKFFKKKLDEAIASPEGQKWAKDFKLLPGEWRAVSLAKWSYVKDFIKESIAVMESNRKD